MARQMESCHKLEKEQPGLKNGEKRNYYAGCARSLGPKDDFKFISENFAIEMILAQRMRRLAKKEPVYLAMIKTTNDTRNDETENDFSNEEPRNQRTVTVNEDEIQTPYPREVQAILNDYANVFPRELPAGLPPQ